MKPRAPRAYPQSFEVWILYRMGRKCWTPHPTFLPVERGEGARKAAVDWGDDGWLIRAAEFFMRTTAEKTFSSRKPVIGMVHIGALPGTPAAVPSLADIEKAGESARWRGCSARVVCMA